MHRKPVLVALVATAYAYTYGPATLRVVYYFAWQASGGRLPANPAATWRNREHFYRNGGIGG